MQLLFAALFGYAVGSVPIPQLLARARGKDLRVIGTGNVGGGNLWRQVGPFIGLAAVLADIGKGALAPLAARLLDMGPAAEVAGALAVVAGQMWPVTLRFQGGRGNAVAAGALIAMSPFAAAWGFLVFFVVAAPRVWSILTHGRGGAASRTVPIAVIVAMLSYTPVALFIGEPVPAIVAPIVVGLILIRRATAPWPADLVTGRPPERSLVTSLLFDRPSLEVSSQGAPSRGVEHHR